jgi:TolB-like protein/Tfp pilus assembly protein PilF
MQEEVFYPPGSAGAPSALQGGAEGEAAENRSAIRSHDVEAELARILASPVFRNAPRHSRFLSFVVHRMLEGRADSIKEYVIGLEVFERAADYDPGSDPIVRAEARRLRSRLSEYYAGPGMNDAIIIDLPKGGYAPVFRERTAMAVAEEGVPETAEAGVVQSASENRSLRRAAGAGLILICAIALAAVLYVRVRGGTAGAPASIAVLPFLNLNAGAGGEYLSDGIAEELTTGLAQLEGLRVVAATSAFQFRGKSEDVRKIGQALDAGALLEGSVSQSGEGLRINVQLINTRNGYHLWSKAYDTGAADLLASEREIVEETAHALRVPVPGSFRSIRLDTKNAEAHDLYLQGRYLWSKRDRADMQESARLFERATKDDPNYALAYVGLADAYTVMAVNAQMSPREALPRAKAALQRALEIDPNVAQAHATLGLLKFTCEWDWRGGEQEFRRAIELQPNYAEAHHWAGLDYMAMGKFDAAEAEFRRAQVLDPLSLMNSEGLEENFYYSRRYDDAIATGLGIPGHSIGWTILAASYMFKGMYGEAMQITNRSTAEGDLLRLLYKGEVRALSGDRAGGLKILEELERENQTSSESYVSPADVGFAYALVGEKERAFAWLEKAYQQHDPALTPLKVNPEADSLRSDARYIQLLKKMGLDD